MKLGQSKTFMFALIMFIIATLSAGILTVVNQVVAPKIAEQQTKAYEEYFQNDFGTSKAEKTEDLGFEYTEGKVLKKFDMGTAGEAFTTSSKGRNGNITLLVNLKKDGSVLGMYFIESSETAAFQEKFIEAVRHYLALPGDVHYSFFAGTKEENGFDITAGSTMTAAGVRSGIRSLYFCKKEGVC